MRCIRPRVLGSIQATPLSSGGATRWKLCSNHFSRGNIWEIAQIKRFCFTGKENANQDGEIWTEGMVKYHGNYVMFIKII